MTPYRALPEQDRAFLAHQLIASLDNTVDADSETQWHEIIDRRSREMAEGRVDTRPEEEVIQHLRAKLNGGASSGILRFSGSWKPPRSGMSSASLAWGVISLWNINPRLAGS
jgi:hypothetical protein